MLGVEGCCWVVSLSGSATRAIVKKPAMLLSMIVAITSVAGPGRP